MLHACSLSEKSKFRKTKDSLGKREPFRKIEKKLPGIKLIAPDRAAVTKDLIDCTPPQAELARSSASS
jgi:hypothetical protein